MAVIVVGPYPKVQIYDPTKMTYLEINILESLCADRLSPHGMLATFHRAPSMHIMGG